MPKDRIPFSRKSFPQKSSLIPLHNRVHNFTTSLSFFTNYFSLEINLERKGRRKKQKEKERTERTSYHSFDKRNPGGGIFPSSPLLPARIASTTLCTARSIGGQQLVATFRNGQPSSSETAGSPSSINRVEIVENSLLCHVYIYIYVYVFEQALSFSQQQQHNNNNFPSLVIFTRRKILRD